jgi:hypothetical protein
LRVERKDTGIKRVGYGSVRKKAAGAVRTTGRTSQRYAK